MAKIPSMPPSMDEVFGKTQNPTPKTPAEKVEIADRATVELVRQALQKYAKDFPLNKSVVMRKIEESSFTVDNFFSQDRNVPLSKVHALIALFEVKEIIHFIEAHNAPHRISRMRKAAKENDLMHNPPKRGY